MKLREGNKLLAFHLDYQKAAQKDCGLASILGVPIRIRHTLAEGFPSRSLHGPQELRRALLRSHQVPMPKIA